MVKICASALMLSAMAGNVMAATKQAARCARPEDMTAVKAAAVQQKLMVAALSCDAVVLYNQFVVAYKKDLQSSDRALQNFFRRLNGRTGTADYHAFKTRLANNSSMQSIGDMPSYCAGAKAAFDAALTEAKISLTAFVSGQTTSVDDAFEQCAYRTAGAGPATVPLPRAKPGEVVLPAAGVGIAAPN
jgi:hypothetical protein